MTLLQFELYNEYHRSSDIEVRYEIGRQIVKINKQNPIPWYWQNDHESSLPGEEWKPVDVPFFYSYVHVSDHGRIRRLRRSINGHRSGNQKNWPEKIVIPSIKSLGRLRYKLEIDGKKEQITVHRAVALTFIDNPLNKPTVNHIDGDPKNCHYLNLEWATYSENEMHSHRVLGKKVSAPSGSASPNWKGKMAKINKDGAIEKVYDCAKDVVRDGFYVSHVYRVASGVRKTTGGYSWAWL
jgi:hypothetical protein